MDNFFDEDDVLGWPIDQLGYIHHFVKDRPINAGNLFTSRNSLSHTGYWSDRDLLHPLADILRHWTNMPTRAALPC